MTYPMDRPEWASTSSGCAKRVRRPTPEVGYLEAARRTVDAPGTTTLQRIYAAATESVAVNGFDGLNMEDIAVRAGCSRATVYRRVGGRDSIRDVVLNQAIVRTTTLVARAVAHLEGPERLETALIVALDTIRTDPVSAALLAGAAAAHTVDSALIASFTGSVADLSGLPLDDTAACELIARTTLALLCWPAADRDAEAAIIRRLLTFHGMG